MVDIYDSPGVVVTESYLNITQPLWMTKSDHHLMLIYDISIWLFNIAMENGPFIDGLPEFTY